MSVTVTRTPFTVTSIGNGTGSGFALSVMQASVAETGAFLCLSDGRDRREREADIRQFESSIPGLRIRMLRLLPKWTIITFARVGPEVNRTDKSSLPLQSISTGLTNPKVSMDLTICLICRDECVRAFFFVSLQSRDGYVFDFFIRSDEFYAVFGRKYP